MFHMKAPFLVGCNAESAESKAPLASLISFGFAPSLPGAISIAKADGRTAT